MKIEKHENGMSSYNLDKLNNSQLSSLFGEFDIDDILIVSISEDFDNNKVFMKSGDIYKLNFSLKSLKSYKKI